MIMNDIRGLIEKLVYKHKRLCVNRVCRARFLYNENGYIRETDGFMYNYRDLSNWPNICGYKSCSRGMFKLSKNY